MAEEKNRGRLFRCVSSLWAAFTWLVILIVSAWAFGALWFDFPRTGEQPWAAWAFAGVVLLLSIFVRPSWRAKLIIAIVVLVILGWWLSQQPRQYRDWKPEVALTAHAEIEGNIVTLFNVRNFEYRTETDFTPHYETRRLDLSNLKGMDIFINTWGSPFMAHPIISYDFGPQGHLCFSIETRPKRGQEYSALGGLYRQFELFYVVADERDVIRLRTNYRKGEDTYLYRLKGPKLRESFLEYISSINELHATPRWYNAITNNCTTAIRQQRPKSERPKSDWRMLVNGYGDELLYERGSIDNSMPFAELKRISHINAKAQAANDSPDFSQKIREGLPGE